MTRPFITYNNFDLYLILKVTGGTSNFQKKKLGAWHILFPVGTDAQDSTQGHIYQRSTNDT